MASSLLLFSIFAVFLGGTLAGYPSFLCPASQLNNQTFFPCDKDCIYQHGAEGGMCGPAIRSDYNCYCGRITGRRVEESLHCIERKGKFKQLCEVDCQCSHGARTGVCDFDRKICKCIGHDPYNKHCHFDTVEEFADFTAGIVPDDSPAWGYLKYFVKRPVKCVEATESPSTKSTKPKPLKPRLESGKPLRESLATDEEEDDWSENESGYLE